MATAVGWSPIPLGRSSRREHQLALVGCCFQDKPHAKNSFIEGYALASSGSGQALLDALTAFAAASKHNEVASAPLVLWGHSAGGQFNYEFTCWKPDRVLAFVVNKGGVYYTHLAPKSARRVPGVFFIGENDMEFRKMSVYGIYAVNRRAHALWTLAVEPKAGHEVGKTRDFAIAFFDAVLPLRQPKANSPTLADVQEDDGWVGNLKSLETRQGKNEGRRMVHLAALGTCRARMADLHEGPVADQRPCVATSARAIS